MAEKLRIGPLDASADRVGFRCGVEVLDRYFTIQVGQDVRRRLAACFVATDRSGRIAGFYTLASAGVALTELPGSVARKLPRYPQVPAVRLGRLAVSVDFRGEGLGAALLADALRRASTAEIAAYAMIVDAKDEQAARFYAHHGFIAISGNPLLLYLPLATAKGL